MEALTPVRNSGRKRPVGAVPADDDDIPSGLLAENEPSTNEGAKKKGPRPGVAKKSIGKVAKKRAKGRRKARC